MFDFCYNSNMFKPESSGAELPEMLTKDVDSLVEIRQAQLAEEEKAESLLDSEPTSLATADQQLVEDYKSGRMIERHDKELLEASERQDPELMDAREAERISKLKKYVVDGKEVYAEGGLKEYSGYKVGEKHEWRGTGSDYENRMTIKILGFTEVDKNDGLRRAIVENREYRITEPLVTTKIVTVDELNENYFKPRKKFFKL
jgi:hypothetical protein